MKLSLGFSPCPNDTFIFYALIHQKIPTGELTFEPYIADVEALNQQSAQEVLQITKISFNAYLDLADKYVLLDSGSALGRNCGPLLISSEPRSAGSLEGGTLAIPGHKTTANFLLDFFLPFPVEKQAMLFHEIEDKVLAKEVAAGVIIHENRFTYQDHGLCLIQDLGAYWESQTGHPIPLGGIIAHRSLPINILNQVNELISQSIVYAWTHQEEVLGYVRQFAQEMDEEIMMQHIHLYVNDFTRDLGHQGREAVKYFFATAANAGKVSKSRHPEDIFLPTR